MQLNGIQNKAEYIKKSEIIEKEGRMYACIMYGLKPVIKG